MHDLLHCPNQLQASLHNAFRHCRCVAVALALFLALQWILPLQRAHAEPPTSANTELLSEKSITTVGITKEVFQSYKDLNDFMEQSPQVTELGSPEALDVMQYGPDVLKTITGPDCNRDGKMDDLTGCRKEFLRLWLIHHKN